MYCGKCGSKVQDNARFCGKCGAPVAQPEYQNNVQEYQKPAYDQYSAQRFMQAQTQFPGQTARPQPDQYASQHEPAQPSGQQTGADGGQPLMWQVTMQGTGAGAESRMWEMELPQQQTYQAQPQTEQAQPQWTQQPAAQSEPDPWAEQPQQTEQAQPQNRKNQQTGGMHADQYGGKWQKVYIIDFLLRMVRVKENIPLFIYLLMNIVLIGFVMTMFTNGNIAMGFALGFGVYLLSMTFALSSMGEKFLRIMVGCKKIEDPALMSRLMPVFQEVYAKAKQTNPNLPDDIQLFVNDDDAPNAFATGRRTVCITRGMLSRSDEQIRGTLGHEFGHLSHRDTDRILVISIGNIFISAFCAMIRIGAYIFEFFAHIFAIFLGGDDGIFFSLMISASRFITVHGVGLFMALWMWIGTALCMKTSRGNEFQADEFSCRLGYGRGLMETLQSFGNEARPEGLFAALASSHPATEERITRIRTLMLQYGGNR